MMKLKKFMSAIIIMLTSVIFAATVYANGGTVAVGLSGFIGVGSAAIGSGNIIIATEFGGSPEMVASSPSGFTVAYSNGQYVIKRADENVYVSAASPFIQASDGFTQVGGKAYRGYIKVIGGSSGITLVNVVDREHYLYGVVPAETYPSWHMEALKAQAVAARTYMSFKNSHSVSGYDICDTTHCQVYSGTQKEHESTTAAVEATRGIMAYYDGKPINAVFSASSGGYTENSENVWSTAVPYLRAVKEIAENEFMEWSRSFTLTQLGNGLGIGKAASITAEYVSTGRVVKLTVNGSGGSKTFEGDNIRSFTDGIGGSLPSLMFTINSYGYSGGGSMTEAVVPESVYVIGADGNAVSRSTNGLKGVVSGGAVYDINQNSFNAIGRGGAAKIFSAVAAATASVVSGERQKVTVNSENISLVGRGNGHGVGMSQYGAKGMAEAGYTYDQILKYYYTGIELK